jgi:hypothetical protein
MRFFEGVRPTVFFNGGKLAKDAKTGVQYWKLKMVIPLIPEEISYCDDLIVNNYAVIETRDNRIEEMTIAASIPSQSIEFFHLSDHKAPVLPIVSATLTDLKMMHSGGRTQLQFEVTLENTDRLHRFVREYAFTQLWAEFRQEQMELSPGLMKAADGFLSPLRSGQVEDISISVSGKEPITFTKEDAERVHAKASKKKVN